MRAVIYAAKSTEDKHGSIETQFDDCRTMAEREGWEVVGEFRDEAFSASQRTEFKNVQRQLEKGRGVSLGDLLAQQERPALAAALNRKGDKTELDVDAAAQELMRLAGLTPYGSIARILPSRSMR